MKTELEIRDRIHAIVTDPRFRAPAADITINAPLALVHIGMASEVRALSFVLNYSEEFKIGEEGAYTLIKRYGLGHILPSCHAFNDDDDYAKGFQAVIEDYQREPQ